MGAWRPEGSVLVTEEFEMAGKAAFLERRS
jgi:hypothetical protein